MGALEMNKQEQDKQIIENAHAGATHIDTNMRIFYYKINEFVTEFFIGGIWIDACNTIPTVKDIRSLADIRELVALRDEVAKKDERIAELEKLVDAVLAVEHKRGGSLNCFGELIYKAPERIFLLAETLKGGDV